MNRRSFFGAAAATAIAGPAAGTVSLAPAAGKRLSIREDDPGYRAYCMLRGDNRKHRVFLDGVEQRRTITADEAIGYVRRYVTTPGGNIAHDGTKGLEEDVYGAVRIEIE